jgi:hypothetical protein
LPFTAKYHMYTIRTSPKSETWLRFTAKYHMYTIRTSQKSETW